MIGKDLTKFAKFNLSVKGGGQEFIGLKGKQIGDKIRDIEKKKFLGEEFGAPAGVIPSPSAKGRKKWKKKLQKQRNEILKLEESPQYKKVIRKLISLRKIPKNLAWNVTKLQYFLLNHPAVLNQMLRLMGENEEKDLIKVLDLYTKNVVYSLSEKGDFATNVLEEKTKIINIPILI